MKAELFSSDFMISMFLFFSSLIIIVFYYQNLQTDVYETDIRNDMYSRTINIASLLATTQGYPHYWNSTNVKVIGLYESGKFNLTKFEELKNIPYDNAKTMLGTGVYNLNVTLKNVTGNIVGNDTFQYTYGTAIDNAQQLSIVKRLGVINYQNNTTKVTMEVVLWE